MIFNSLKEWLNSLREASKQGNTCILVEGKRDFQKLSSFGIENILTLKGKKFYDVVEDIVEKYDRCVILFDLDKHGEKMTVKFSNLLKAEGVEVDLSFRDFLKILDFIEIENITLLE